MKTSDIRKPYAGATRSLVVALDVGTTFSGVSYAILEPGEIPKIHGVTRFPGQEHQAGNSKIPTILYYDRDGNLMAAGAEADTSTTLSMAEDEGWLKVELFKLRLRPRQMKLEMNGMKFAPLPPGKTAVHVFGDFLGYLFSCTRNFIIDTHGNGAALWKTVEPTLQFVLSHPNGWEGAQQTKMRRAAVHGGLIPDTPEGKARIWFVTEGEASLHACVLNGLASDVLSDRSKSGFLVADAGGGTLDISAYTIRSQQPLVIEEIAPPDCIFAGSVFVSRRARVLFEEKLKNSKYGTPDALDHITKRFDETTKRLFRNKNDPQFIVFGSPLDKDPSVGIRSGQLRLSGAEVAELFEPSIQGAVGAIKAQINASSGMIKSVFLVGGYAASAWLFGQLQERLAPFNVSVSRPDSQTSKAVADGAIGFFCDHHVSARVSKFMYGVEYLREFNPEDSEHVMRKDRLTELPSGPRLLPDAFDCILARGVKVKESTVFTRKYCTELTSLSLLSVFEVEIWCYRGGDVIPKWILRNHEEFSTLCLVRADLSPLSGSAEAKKGKHGRTYWNIVFSVEIHFGLTEFRARIKWVDNGVTKYGPASIIYNERGHRSDEDEPDGIPEDDTIAQSTKGSTRAPSRAQSRDSFHTPGPTAPSSKRASVAGPSSIQPPPPPPPPIDPIPPIDTTVTDRAPSSRVAEDTPTRELANAISDGLRGRSKSKSKARTPSVVSEVTSPSTPSSSKLGEALSSVWGAGGGVATPSTPTARGARSVAGSLKSKKPTPAASPKVAETPVAPLAEEMPPAPPPPAASESPPAPVDSSTPNSTIVETSATPTSVVEDVLERSVESANVTQPITDPAPSTTATEVNAEETVSPGTDTRPPVVDAPITLTENKPPSTVIAPISLPDDVAVDPQTQPISAASPTGEGMLSLSNGIGALSNAVSDLLSPPEPAAAGTTTPGSLSALSGQLGGLASGLSSRFGWGSAKSPGGSAPGSPKPENGATPKPASTPRASRPPTVPPSPKVTTPKVATPKAATPAQASTPVPTSTPKAQPLSLPLEDTPKEEDKAQEVEPATQETTSEQITEEPTTSKPEEGSTSKVASVANSPKVQPASVGPTETSAEEAQPAVQVNNATPEAAVETATVETTAEQVAAPDATASPTETNGVTQSEAKDESGQNATADASENLAADLADQLEGGDEKNEEEAKEEEEEGPAKGTGGGGSGAKKGKGGGGKGKKGKGKKK
ncbi:hypothetical protein Moror_14297 [Moniliophthora roreri MCA 2997]|uniref:Uncharacterized protein n=1 Tax=Moniliophthora roreri (strain MCA 2997) TaxID=1381753 RepID=V2XPB0_MONRO|nr:hypothetical protein Moror_14297 [Moniliophthora roreri MCA 2997]